MAHIHTSGTQETAQLPEEVVGVCLGTASGVEKQAPASTVLPAPMERSAVELNTSKAADSRSPQTQGSSEATKKV